MYSTFFQMHTILDTLYYIPFMGFYNFTYIFMYKTYIREIYDCNKKKKEKEEK